MKKYFIYKKNLELYQSKKNLELHQNKFKKHNIQQFYFGTLVLALHCYCGNNA